MRRKAGDRGRTGGTLCQPACSAPSPLSLMAPQRSNEWVASGSKESSGHSLLRKECSFITYSLSDVQRLSRDIVSLKKCWIVMKSPTALSKESCLFTNIQISNEKNTLHINGSKPAAGSRSLTFEFILPITTESSKLRKTIFHSLHYTYFKVSESQDQSTSKSKNKLTSAPAACIFTVNRALDDCIIF